MESRSEDEVVQVTLSAGRMQQEDGPDLEGVKEEDRGLVRDVITLLAGLQHPGQLCRGWNVNPIGTTHYEVNGLIDAKQGEWEVFLEDLDLVQRLDPFRVKSVSVRVAGQAAQVRVAVMSRTERVLVTEYDVLRVRKRRRWLTFSAQ